MSAASDGSPPPPPPPEDEPTRALLLAQALDMCVSAERRLPGSADHIIAHQPTWAREELRRLVSLAGSLDAVATNAVMSDDFRVAARGRLLQRIRGGAGLTNGSDSATEHLWSIGTFPSTNGYHSPEATRGSKRRWLWRTGLGGVLAAALGTAATLTASATALPGEPLYPIKQAQEELGLRFAPDDQARALAWLNQGDARLNETARLLQAGRTSDIPQTTRRFDEAIARATTTFVVTIADRPAETPVTANIETKLNAQQAQLESLISSAPEPARADLRQALMATERGLALVANTQADQSVDQRPRGQSMLTAPVPTMAVEAIPSSEAPSAVRATSRPSAPSGAVADKHDVNVIAVDVVDQPSTDEVVQPPVEAEASSPPAQPQVAVGRGAVPGSRGAPAVPASRRAAPAPASTSDEQKDEQHFEALATQPGVVAPAPETSQQAAPRHLNITLTRDPEPTPVQNDTRHNDERQVVVPTREDHPQVAGQAQPATARAQESTQSSGVGNVGTRAESDKSSKGGNANASSSSSSNPAKANGNSDEHAGKSSGGGDQNARPSTEQNSNRGAAEPSSKGGGDSSRGGDGSHGGDNGHEGDNGHGSDNSHGGH